ncbi:MAG: alpha/beta fold hydrolase [Actinomycetota bacterium]
MTTPLRKGTVKANGLEFAYLEQGSGPLVLLMHGFPDNAHTWSYQMPALADAGYRAVAPFLRGYPPTQIPEDGYFDAATLATDAKELILALNDVEPAYYVGTDWGTLTAFPLMQAYPEVVRRSVVMAVPYPLAAAMIVTKPELIHHTFHVWFQQLPGIAEAAISAGDFAYIEYLWRFWEPGFEDPQHIASVKRTLATDGALTAALGYYRAMFDPEKSDPDLADVRAKFGLPMTVPTLAIFGMDDPLGAFAEEHRPFFSGELRIERPDGGQHFIHRSRPAVINEMILSWLSAG